MCSVSIKRMTSEGLVRAPEHQRLPVPMGAQKATGASGLRVLQELSSFFPREIPLRDTFSYLIRLTA